MNRRYTKERYLELVEKLRTAMPDIALTTDIIVGYPGETEEDFLDTMDVVDKANYDSAYTFIYSRRTGTPAAAREDQVPEDVVKDTINASMCDGVLCIELPRKTPEPKSNITKVIEIK